MCVSGELMNGYSSRSVSTAANSSLHRTSRALSARTASALEWQEQPQQQIDQKTRAEIQQRQTEHHAPGPRGQIGVSPESPADPADEAVAAGARELLQERAGAVDCRRAIEHPRLGLSELRFADDAAIPQRLQLLELL